jgi:GNAT superfamily N-acetyltransferase
MAINIEAPERDDQFQAWAEIMRDVEGLWMDVAELRHSLENDQESLWRLGYLDGRPAGVAVGRPSSLPGSAYGAVRVRPNLRRQGLGSELFAEIVAYARDRGATEIWGRMRADDADSLAFAAKRGFREVGRERDVVLELAKAPPAAVRPPEGIDIVSFADRPDLIPAVFELDNEVTVDIPAHRPHEPIPYDRWAHENLEGPGAFPEACFIALAGEEVVGYTSLRRYGADSAEAENRLTAVRRTWRRKGIATALKLAQIEAARAAGLERIFTTNDETNVGMRGVNARLGFEPEPERVVVSGPVPTGEA